MTDLTPDLQFLVGEPMNAVRFVMDYVELQFSGSYLRCLTPPTVHLSTGSVTFPRPGSRDALCERIGAVVQAISAHVEGDLRVTFGDGSVVTSLLASEGRKGHEALHFRNGSTGVTQWW